MGDVNNRACERLLRLRETTLGASQRQYPGQGRRKPHDRLTAGKSSIHFKTPDEEARVRVTYARDVEKQPRNRALLKSVEVRDVYRGFLYTRGWVAADVGPFDDGRTVHATRENVTRRSVGTCIVANCDTDL